MDNYYKSFGNAIKAVERLGKMGYLATDKAIMLANNYEKFANAAYLNATISIEKYHQLADKLQGIDIEKLINNIHNAIPKMQNFANDIHKIQHFSNQDLMKLPLPQVINFAKELSSQGKIILNDDYTIQVLEYDQYETSKPTMIKLRFLIEVLKLIAAIYEPVNSYIDIDIDEITLFEINYSSDNYETENSKYTLPEAKEFQPEHDSEITTLPEGETIYIIDIMDNHIYYYNDEGVPVTGYLVD